MTVNTSNKRIEYSGNGSTTVFAYNFRILDETHLEVILVNSSGVESVQTLTTHYTVAGAGDAGGGDVTMVAAPASGESLVLRRKMPFTQDIDYVSGDPFPAETHERGIDERVMEAQELVEITDRALKAPKQDSAIGDMPAAAARIGKLLTFGTTGDPEATAYTSAQVQAAINVASNAGTNDTEFIFHQLGGSPYSLADYLNGLAFVSVKDPRFGAVGDGSTDDGTALMAAFQYGMDNSVAVYIPSGVYRTKRNTLKLDSFPANGSLTIFGDGPTSIIKLEDNGITDTGQVMMRIKNSVDLEAITLKDFVLDMNARTCAVPPGAYDWQQSHCLQLLPQAGTTTKLIKYENLIIKDPVADGMNVQATGRIKNWVIDHCAELDRTRVRSSIQMSYLPDKVTISGFVGKTIEAEPLASNTYVDKAQIQISNSHIEILDAAGAGATDREKTHWTVSNTYIESSTYVSYCKFTAVNCPRIPAPSVFSYNGKDCSMTQCTIYHPYDSDTNTLSSLVPRYSQSVEQGWTFNDCEFLIDTDTTGNINGVLITPDQAVPVADMDKVRWEFNGCKFDERAQATATAYRVGTLVFNDCVMAGWDYVVRLATSNTYATKLYMHNIDSRKVTGDLFKVVWSTPDQTTTICQAYLTGDWLGDESFDLQTESGGVNINNNTIFRSNRVVMTDTTPTNGIRGDRLRRANITVGLPSEYQCTFTSATGTAVWRMIQQAGVGMDTTANRPTPTANDVGLLYLDTTLDADGHPIWWNGAAWIDAQGVTPP